MRPFAVMRTAWLPRFLPVLAGLVTLVASTGSGPVRAQGNLFGAREVDQSRFILVVAPIGDGTRAQLNIYEQITNKRPCFATSGSAPARVDPLLGSFDFTGICTRYLDANGYSLRVGGSDLATVYRLSVVRTDNDNLLLAAPTRNQSGPEMIVARTNGNGAGFLQFIPEPGWRLMRRQFGNRVLGHVYLYRETWPDQGAVLAAPASPTPATVVPVPSSPPLPAPSPQTPMPAQPAPAATQPVPSTNPASAPADRPARPAPPTPAEPASGSPVKPTGSKP